MTDIITPKTARAMRGALVALILLPGMAAAQDGPTIRQHQGILPDGTAWMVRVPEDWNGVLLRDLDFVSNAESDGARERYDDLLERGFAFAGLARHPLRLWQYDPAREIANLERVQEIFSETERAPDRVLQYGCSGGGLDGLASAESFAGRIDGAVVLAAHTPVWIMSSFLDGWFAMQALLSDAYVEAGLGDAADLKIVGLPNVGASEPSLPKIQAAWRAAIEMAGETPEGRARLALAFALGQWSPWMVEGTELPDPSDIEAMADMIVASALRIADNVGGSSRLLFENAASGQQLSGNEEVDYADFYDNAAPAMRGIVEALMTEAELDLAAEIARVESHPRVAASDYALEWWAQPGRTTTGALEVPTIRLHMLGDWAIPYTLMQGYGTLVEAAGAGGLYRQSLVLGTGHCEFMPAESSAAVEALMERLDDGAWPETSPDALNARGAALDTGTEPRFVEVGPWAVGAYNRPWTPGG